jgi:putative ABC transport system permease protein
LLPNDVRVLTKQGFIDFEQNYWRSSTSIGFIFTLGAAMGFVVGCVIVYQVLYTDVSDHLPEYATLMAMGYKLSPLLAWWCAKAAAGLVRLSPAYLAGQGCIGLCAMPPGCRWAWISPGPSPCSA